MGVRWRVRCVVGRDSSCRRSVAWSGCGSGCLRRGGGTDEPEGVVVVLAEQAQPVVVSAVLRQSVPLGRVHSTARSK